MEGLEFKVSSGSLYEQVHDDLLNRIHRGDVKPGEMLPTEEELCRHYGVSRITIRRAVTELAAQFLVVRKRGVGTVVTKRPVDRRAFRFTGFLENRTALKAEPLSSASEPANEEVASMLQVKRGSMVQHIRVITRRNGEAFTYTDAYTVDLPELSGTDKDYRTEAAPSYAFGARLGRRIERAEQELDAVAADSVSAKHLGIARGTPVLRARRVYLDSTGQPIRFVNVIYHPDRYRFTVDLRPTVGASMFEAAMAVEDAPPKTRDETRRPKHRVPRNAPKQEA
jgi:GntR family transcriptional regulator